MAKGVELLASYWTLAGDCYAQGPSEVSPIPLRDRVEAAAWAGYTGMGFVIQDLLVQQDAIGYPAMKRMLDDNGIKHVEVEFLGDWFKSGTAKTASDKVRKQLLVAAAELGARNVKCAGEMFTDNIDIARMTETFADVCDDFAKIGIGAAIEILPMTSIRTLKQGAAIVGGAGRPNGGLCIDIWHMVRGGIDFAEIAALPLQYVKSVELDDASAVVLDDMWVDTLFHRLYPGEGVFDCRGFIDAVRKTGFNGVYGVEIINEKYRLLPLREQAKRSFDGTMAQFAPQETGNKNKSAKKSAGGKRGNKSQG